MGRRRVEDFDLTHANVIVQHHQSRRRPADQAEGQPDNAVALKTLDKTPYLPDVTKILHGHPKVNRLNTLTKFCFKSEFSTR